MDINFPSAKESRDKLSTRENQVFRQEIANIHQLVTDAISRGNDSVTVSSMHDQTKKFLEEKGYFVKEESCQRDSYWLIKW